MKASRLLILACLVGLVAACSPDGDAPQGQSSDTSMETEAGQAPENVNGVSTISELNPTAGSVILPLDRVSISAVEELLIKDGSVVAAQTCASTQGVDYLIWPAYPATLAAIYQSESYFGPWTQEQAENYGFVEPAPPGDLIVNGVVDGEHEPLALPPQPNQRTLGDLSESERQIIEDCFANGEDAELFSAAQRRTGQWYREYTPLERDYTRNKSAVSLVDELLACYGESQIATAGGDTPWWPEGARAEKIDEQQVALALKVVECKESIDFTKRMATIEAAEQTGLIEKYAAEMIETRKILDKAVLQAQSLIDNNVGGYLPLNPAFAD